MRVLVVEDDPTIADGLRTALELSGFVVEHSDDGEIGHYRGETEAFDAIVLDLSLPTMDGLVVLKRWRKAKILTPVLVLTARGAWEERVEGIDAGADDYLAKPFRIEEVVARIRALVRRASGNPTPVIEVGALTLDTRQMRVSVDGALIPLTPQEYRLVAYLAHHKGRVVDQIELTEHLYLQDFERDSNAIEVLVGRARRKLGAGIIETRRGFGYVIGEAP
ncbi:response regulator transcription factor [Pelagibacterium luteolum]|uniref:DNA-binding response regulator, OmpR family, contains REC and winged-helix (WHTH) domain n=1 Tax=Pelagibacterium luteolum TaxID=440168 RepID=A0A1G7S0M2_9HYPH|nr:response regulator transcription factor [Pelagibacterium luteolum]SDG16567.1 DNA-binding response regulator, OmpR family, contains REC and winged-helix (wHTH) domain [Pelagibacterium luteolum]